MFPRHSGDIPKNVSKPINFNALQFIISRHPYFWDNQVFIDSAEDRACKTNNTLDLQTQPRWPYQYPGKFG